MKSMKASPKSIEWTQDFIRSIQTTNETTCSDYSLAKNPSIKCCPVTSCPHWFDQINHLVSARTQQNLRNKCNLGSNAMSRKEISHTTEEARLRIESIVFDATERTNCCVIPT